LLTDRQTDKWTNNDDYISSLVEVIISADCDVVTITKDFLIKMISALISECSK